MMRIRGADDTLRCGCANIVNGSKAAKTSDNEQKYAPAAEHAAANANAATNSGMMLHDAIVAGRAHAASYQPDEGFHKRCRMG